MKKILYSTTVVLAAAVIMTSCKDNNTLASGAAQVTPVPASEYAEFKEWKQQQQQNTTSYTTPVKTRPVVIHKTYVVNRTAPTAAVQPARKKGWSKAAKGGVIGAGTGAAAGALLVKNNRALGAVIGGIVGGGVGYEIGRSKDKQDGRY